jgi:hypothetical protein
VGSLAVDAAVRYRFHEALTPIVLVVPPPVHHDEVRGVPLAGQARVDETKEPVEMRSQLLVWDDETLPMRDPRVPAGEWWYRRACDA